MSAADDLLAKIEQREALVGVIGLGYVGLPLAMRFAAQGSPVLGFDVDAAKVAQLEAGESYIPRIPAAELQAQRAAGRFQATADPARLAEADVILIAVPTPITRQREPDLRYVEASARSIAAALRPGQLIVLESTTYPGTTDEVVRPILEAGGLKAGSDFFLAFSPEREDPGVAGHSIGEIPKVVGADDPDSGRLAQALYAVVAPSVVPVSSSRAAEASKLLENIYRGVNIALVNELKILFDRMGIDVWEVIDASSTKPFGFQRFNPGPGWGGHCLAPGERVRVRGEGLAGLYRVDELFHQLRDAGAAAVADGGVWVRTPGLEALALDAGSGDVRWSAVSALFRARYRGPACRISTRDGRSLTVTDRHPMLVWRGGRFETVEAAAMRPGDQVPVGADLGDESPDPVVDLIDVVPAAEQPRVWVRIPGEPWRMHEALLKRRFGWTIRDSIRSDALRLDRFLEVETELGIDRGGLRLLTGMGRARREWPARLRATPDFARFVGYYLAEGCITADRNGLRVRLTFNRDEQDYVSDVRAILDRAGFPTSVFQDGTWHSTTIKASSLLLGWLLRDVWRCGVGSESMRIPDWVERAGWRHKRELAAGLLRGDGDVYVAAKRVRYAKNGTESYHHDVTAQIGYFSSSPELLEQAWCLLQDLGLRPRRKPGRPHLRMDGVTAGEQLARVFEGAKGDRLDLAAKLRRRRTTGSALREGLGPGLFLDTVRAVDRAVHDGWVYSLEVEDTQTFTTNSGWIVHNCIPTDPFYLAWKAREYGTPTRFIELSGEINAKMARWVAGKVGDALNERGTALNGAKVLLLGIAYKKDVGDDRGSPAFPLAVELQKKGAVVCYHDPHVPQLPAKRDYPGLELAAVDCAPATLAAQDAVVIVTDHSDIDYAAVVEHARLVIDTRNATAGVTTGRDKIVRA